MFRNKKHILITGATGGIGSALALSYAQKGMSLSIFGRQEDKLNEIAMRCRDLGAEVYTYRFDLRDFSQLDQQIEIIDKRLPIDLVVANAGVAVYLDSNAPRETWDDIQKTIDINLKSTIATITPLVVRMQARRKGQIALVSSMAAYQGIAVSPSYCASKAGLKAYGEALRLLLAKDNIQVSVICPGFIDSELSRRFPGKKPFLLTAETAAKKIKCGLQKNKGNITFPFWFGLGARLLILLPGRIKDFILQKLEYNPSGNCSPVIPSVARDLSLSRVNASLGDPLSQAPRDDRGAVTSSE